MKLDDFFKFLSKLPVDDYIVRIKLKYDEEKDYRYINVILEFDGDDYVWAVDWCEGEQDVQVIGYIAVSEIDSFNIPTDIFTCGKCIHLIFKDYRYMNGRCSKTGLYHNFEDKCDHEEEMS